MPRVLCSIYIHMAQFFEVGFFAPLGEYGLGKGAVLADEGTGAVGFSAGIAAPAEVGSAGIAVGTASTAMDAAGDAGGVVTGAATVAQQRLLPDQLGPRLVDGRRPIVDRAADRDPRRRADDVVADLEPDPAAPR